MKEWGVGAEMGECRGGGGDCLIKLFGTTIPVPEPAATKDDLLQQHNGGGSNSSSSSSSAECEDATKENAQQQQQDGSDPPPQPEVVDAEDPASNKQGQGQGKPMMKKPDKVLPCPRCSSMDTKFCYFNNYNVNQPRHFCKNCQRYWTAGGAMRNVPVGAGRRKNKNAAAAASQFLQRVRAAAAAAGDPAVLRTNGGGTVLSFGHVDPPLAEQQKEKPLLIPIGSTTTTTITTGSEGSISTDDKNLQSDNKVAVAKPAASANNGLVQQQHPTNMWPYYHPPGIAIPIFPSAPAYWGCMVPAAGGWSLPWPAPVQSPTPAPPQGFSLSPTTCSAGAAAALSSVSSSGADSLTLVGNKHARDVDDDDDDGRRMSHSCHHGSGGGKVWAPKTIRIDDADEVAKSSIWSLIGAKGAGGGKHSTDIMRHGLCRNGTTVFEPKHEATAKQAMLTSSPLLHANPVALTRSLTFQEGS